MFLTWFKKTKFIWNFDDLNYALYASEKFRYVYAHKYVFSF